MQKYKSNIITTTGLAQRNVSVRVLDDNGALATLYADRYGQTPIANPQVTAVDGTFAFYAANGRYSLQTTINGVTYTDQDVVLAADPEDMLVAGPIADAVNNATASVLATATNAASAAQASQSAAASSAGSAATSEANALASRNAAASSADAALISEGNTLANKNASDVSASAAATSASNAATSESNALASKNAAATSAANAATYAQGYANGGAYSAGITLNDRFTFVAKDNELYRLADAVALPYTTTGDWTSESSKFVSIGDRNLRQELSSTTPGAGVALATYMPPWTGAVSRTQHQRNRDFLTLADFGVYPDSGNDEYAGIQAAIDASSSTGLTLYAQAGTYNYSAPLVISNFCNFVGCGPYSTRFVKTARTPLSVANRVSPQDPAQTDTYNGIDCIVCAYPDDGMYVANIRLEGMSFSSSGGGQSQFGLYAPRLSVSRFIDVHFGAVLESAIYSFTAWMILWMRVHTHDAAVGFRIYPNPTSSGIIDGGTSNAFVDCWAIDISDVAWQIKGIAYSTLLNCGADRVFRAGATAPQCAYWLEACKNLSMVNCGSENARGHVLYSLDSDAMVIGMNATTLIHGDASMPVTPILDIAGTSRITLDGCNFDTSGDVTNLQAILVYGTAKLWLRRNTRLSSAAAPGGTLANGEIIDEERSAVKASVTFTVSGGVVTVTDAFNVSGVNRDATGSYTVVVQTPHGAIKPVASSSAFSTRLTAISASAVSITTANLTGAAEDAEIVSVVFV